MTRTWDRLELPWPTDCNFYLASEGFQRTLESFQKVNKCAYFFFFNLYDFYCESTKSFMLMSCFSKLNFPKGNAFSRVPEVVTLNQRDLILNGSSEKFLSNVSGPISLPQVHCHCPSSCSIRSHLGNHSHVHWPPCSVPSLLPSTPPVCTNPSDFSKNTRKIILFCFHVQ